MTGGAVFADPFAVGAVGTDLIAPAFFPDRRFRILSFFGTAIMLIEVLGYVIGHDAVVGMALLLHAITG